MNRFLIPTLLVAATLLAACEREPSREARAQDRYALELANCAAYYAVMADCVEVRTEADQANVAQTKVLALRAMRMSAELSSGETASARVDRGVKRINERLQNQCLDPQPVIEEYGQLCVKAVDDPQGRAAHWLDAVE